MLATIAIGVGEVGLVLVTSHAGRVETLLHSGLVDLLAPGRVVEQRGPGHLETGTGSRAVISWPAIASAALEGRAGVEWFEDQDQPGLRVLDCQSLELEVRRGPLRVKTSNGWELLVERGALGLSRDASGGYRLENRAGLELRMWHQSGPYLRSASAPQVGEVLLLLGSESSSAAQRELWPAWEQYHWPFGPQLEPATEAPLVPEAVSVPAPEPVAAPVPVVEPVPVAEPAPEIIPEPIPAPTPPPAPAPAPAPIVRPKVLLTWAHASPEQLRRYGPLIVEQHPGLTIHKTNDGGYSLRLAHGASGKLRVWSASALHELEAGGLIVFDASGQARAFLGSVERRDAALPDAAQRAAIAETQL